jgi:hypothetical protein
MNPNLFEYATKELSQDAFVCWLLKWLPYPGGAVADASWQLFQSLFHRLSVTVERDRIVAVHIKRQFHNVDIVVVIELRSAPMLCLVIEDKLDALLTGNDQLARNLDNVLAHADEWAPLSGVERARVYGVLFKTGYDFDLPCPPRYVKLGGQELKDWAKHLPAQALEASDVLAHWVSWWCREWGKAEQHVLAATHHVGDVPSGKWPDNRIWDGPWAHPVYQYTFFKRVFRVEPKDISDVKEDRGHREICFHPVCDRARIENFLQGTSRGRWWIQYHFDGPGKDEFFYRLDWQSGMWGISLRFYKKDKSAAELSEMRAAAAVLDRLLKAHAFVTAPFRPSDARIETTCLLIDPYRSPRLLELSAVHAEFMRERFVG